GRMPGVRTRRPGAELGYRRKAHPHRGAAHRRGLTPPAVQAIDRSTGRPTPAEPTWPCRSALIPARLTSPSVSAPSSRPSGRPRPMSRRPRARVAGAGWRGPRGAAAAAGPPAVGGRPPSLVRLGFRARAGRVPAAETEAAPAAADRRALEALAFARGGIEAYHRRQLPKD